MGWGARGCPEDGRDFLGVRASGLVPFRAHRLGRWARGAPARPQRRPAPARAPRPHVDHPGARGPALRRGTRPAPGPPPAVTAAPSPAPRRPPSGRGVRRRGPRPAALSAFAAAPGTHRRLDRAALALPPARNDERRRPARARPDGHFRGQATSARGGRVGGRRMRGRAGSAGSAPPPSCGAGLVRAFRGFPVGLGGIVPSALCCGPSLPLGVPTAGHWAVSWPAGAPYSHAFRRRL